MEAIGPADFEPEAPMDRLPSESPDPTSGNVEFEPLHPASGPGPGTEGPGFDALTEGWEDAPANPDAGDTHVPSEVPLPDMDEPLDFSGDDGGETPFDLDEYAETGKLDSQSWAPELDLPGSEETIDNRPVPAIDAIDAIPPRERERPPEPKPARHAIRVIAASVSNDGNVHKPQAARQDTSLVLQIVLAIGRGGKWLWNRFAKR